MTRNRGAMRQCLRIIVFPAGLQRRALRRTRYACPQLLVHNDRRMCRVRSYADEASVSNVKHDEIPPANVESTGTVPADTITTEKPEIQEPPPTSNPVPPLTQSSSPPPYLPKSGGLKKAVPFKLEETNNPKRAATQLQRALTQTSLRKKLGWSEPLRGINPAYDIAVEYLKHDRQEKIRNIARVESFIRRERESNLSYGK